VNVMLLSTPQETGASKCGLKVAKPPLKTTGKHWVKNGKDQHSPVYGKRGSQVKTEDPLMNLKGDMSTRTPMKLTQGGQERGCSWGAGG